MSKPLAIICSVIVLLVSGSAAAFTPTEDEILKRKDGSGGKMTRVISAKYYLEKNDKKGCVSECKTVYPLGHCEEKCSAIERKLKDEYEESLADYKEVYKKIALEKYKAGAFPFVREESLYPKPTLDDAVQLAEKNVKKNDGTFCRSDCGHYYSVEHCEEVCSTVELTLKRELEERQAELNESMVAAKLEKYK